MIVPPVPSSWSFQLRPVHIQSTMDVPYNLPLPHPRHCPTEDEIQSSKRFIKDIEQEIGSVKGKGDKSQAQLQSLQRHRKNHESYISPLRRLPREILGLIVRTCLEELVEMPTLSQTCGTIRYIINGTATFWNKISLFPHYPYRYDISVSHLCSESNLLLRIFRWV
jgi:hypothetical protein